MNKKIKIGIIGCSTIANNSTIPAILKSDNCELGFIGSGFILICFGLIFYRAFSIAKRTNDLFGRLVCVGVISWFAFQAFENIGMTMGLVPMTGVPLPFVSYGGSSMFATFIGFGLLQNVYLRSR